PVDHLDDPRRIGRPSAIDRRRGASMGVFRTAPGGGGRLLPIERSGEEMVIDPEFTGGATDGDLVEVEIARLGRFGLP
ncbi:hypothetical protein ACEQ6C_40565, partial [Rhizobium ruizarguesonis]